MSKAVAKTPQETTKKVGRPTVVTEQVLQDLKSAFVIGATNLEAAVYAGITEKTLYNYIERNPDFLQQIATWKADPILKAKQQVVKDITKDTKVAQWYLERRDPEFKPKAEITAPEMPSEENQKSLADIIIQNEQSKQPEPPVEAEIVREDPEQPSASA